MVSKASEDFPEPLNPVITTSLLRGIESVMFFRLCSRAPLIMILFSDMFSMLNQIPELNQVKR
jgi:hypothetical protein